MWEQERLEKEKKLSKDLGQAATKLQQLLKATQDQLSKEKDTVRTLQEHLDGKVRQHNSKRKGSGMSQHTNLCHTFVLKGEYTELKEGTSV